MPIFEYICNDCGRKFEAIQIGSDAPECPGCKSQKLEKQLSSFAVNAKSSSSPLPKAPCGAPGGSCGSGGCGWGSN